MRLETATVVACLLLLIFILIGDIWILIYLDIPKWITVAVILSALNCVDHILGRIFQLFHKEL